MSSGNHTVANNLFFDNHANTWAFDTDSPGGGIYSEGGDVVILNNTITGNSGKFGEGLFATGSGAYHLFNNIIWANGNQDVYVENDLNGDFIAELSLYPYSNNLTYASDLPVSIDSSNKIDIDPLFFDANNNDFTLSNKSPMIDTGYADTPNLPATDLDGRLRVIGEVVDIGAYEYHEYEFCDVNNLTLDNEIIVPGGDNYSSEVGIDTNGIVTISSDADVVLTAPVIRLNPGFSVESGAQLLLRAQSVTCPL